MIILHGREWVESVEKVIGEDNIKEAWNRVKEASKKAPTALASSSNVESNESVLLEQFSVLSSRLSVVIS